MHGTMPKMGIKFNQQQRLSSLMRWRGAGMHGDASVSQKKKNHHRSTTRNSSEQKPAVTPTP